MRVLRRGGSTKRAPRTDPAKASPAHSQWVRAHPRIDDSAFPEYPDDRLRRGASRGALPNGNPWQPERDEEKPGPPWARSSEPAPTPHFASELRPRARHLTAPPIAPARVAVTGGAPTLADRRIAEEVETQLSYAKTFDGKCIEVSVHGEDVFLRGCLPSLHAKVEAGLLATSVRGVTRVHNQIRVQKHS
jgi:hypothetical protein